MKRHLFLLFLLLAGHQGLAQLSPLAIGTIPAGKTLVVRYDVTINDPTSATAITNQGVITGTNFTSVSTNTTNTPIISSNANLSALVISPGTLSPPFAASTTAYTASVPTSASSVAVTPTVEQANATIAVNGTAVASGSSINLPLALCANTISISVTAQDGVFSKVYSLTINRAAPPLSLTVSSPLSCTAPSVTLTATPGFATYTFGGGVSQPGGPSSNTATVSTAGTYSLTATVAGGCSSMATVSVTGSTTSTPVSLTASSPLSCSVSSVTLTATSGFASYSFSPVATQIGGAVSNVASLTAAGVYSVTALNASFCSSTASITITQSSDLTPVLYARPTLQYGTSNFALVVDVVELNGVPTIGSTIVKITKDSKVALSLPGSATLVNNRSVQNSAWSFDPTSDLTYYILTTKQSVDAGDKLSFGLDGVLSAGATTGLLNLSAIILGGTVCEMKLSNNTDADKIEYFQQ